MKRSVLFFFIICCLSIHSQSNVKITNELASTLVYPSYSFQQQITKIGDDFYVHFSIDSVLIEKDELLPNSYHIRVNGLYENSLLQHRLYGAFHK